MSENTAPSDAPVVFHDGVLVETVSPLRSHRRSVGGPLFRVDYFGRGIAVAYADQLRVVTSVPSRSRLLRAEESELLSPAMEYPTVCGRVLGRTQLSLPCSRAQLPIGGAA